MARSDIHLTLATGDQGILPHLPSDPFFRFFPGCLLEYEWREERDTLQPVVTLQVSVYSGRSYLTSVLQSLAAQRSPFWTTHCLQQERRRSHQSPKCRCRGRAWRYMLKTGVGLAFCLSSVPQEQQLSALLTPNTSLSVRVLPHAARLCARNFLR